MNYKLIGKDLAFQEAKGHQWKLVPNNELVRLALLGVEHERQLTQRAADGALCPVCDFEQKLDEVCEEHGVYKITPRR